MHSLQAAGDWLCTIANRLEFYIYTPAHISINHRWREVSRYADLFQSRDIKLNWQNWSSSLPVCLFEWCLSAPLKNLSDIVYLFSCGYTDIQFHWLCYSDQTCSFFTSTLLWPTLNLSRRLLGVEKLLDYRGYYCGLKYASPYVGALSPGPIRFDWVYTGWHHLWEWRWWMNHSQNCFSDCVRPRALSLMRHTRTYKYAEAEHVMGEDVVYRSM